MPCLYSLKTMYRRLPFIILLSILAVFSLRASVVAPPLPLQKYFLDDYKDSWPKWGLTVSFYRSFFVAYKSRLVCFYRDDR